jgi:hypothetical protein
MPAEQNPSMSSLVMEVVWGQPVNATEVGRGDTCEGDTASHANTPWLTAQLGAPGTSVRYTSATTPAHYSYAGRRHAITPEDPLRGGRLGEAVN